MSKKGKDNWYKSSLNRAKDNNQCFNCTLKDSKVEYLGMRPYLTRGICSSHKKIANKTVLEKLQLNSFESDKFSLSKYIRSSYNNEFPGNRGFHTEKFTKWAKDFVNCEIKIAEKDILKNQEFKYP